MNGIISTNVLINVPAMFEASGYVTSHRRADMPSITKKCARCGENKFFWNYYKYSRNKDGLHSYCKQCVLEKTRLRYKETPDKVKATIRRWSKSHPENNRERSRKYALAHPEKIKMYRQNHLDQERENRKAWYQANKEKTKEYARQYKLDNEERLKDAARLWRKENPEKIRAKAHRRRARLQGNGGNYTPGEWKDLCSKYNNKCLCCGKSKKLTPDHVIPLSAGGTNNIENIQPLCLSCNCRKGTKHIDYRV
jgi:hypothetical protein